MIKFIASSGQVVEVSRAGAARCKVVEEMLKDDDDDTESPSVPVPAIDFETLKRVAWFLEQPVQEKATYKKPFEDGPLKEFATDLAKVENLDTLIDLAVAANHVHCNSLMLFTCAIITSLIKNKSADELRAMYDITKPTPEEEQQIRKDNAWIYTIEPMDLSELD